MLTSMNVELSCRFFSAVTFSSPESLMHASKLASIRDQQANQRKTEQKLAVTLTV
jgi:hypothetical protein